MQINGKTRDILSVKKNTSEKDINRMIMEKSKAKKQNYFFKNKMSSTKYPPSSDVLVPEPTYLKPI